MRLFASLRDAVGRSEIDLDLPDAASAEDAWARLAADHPAVATRRRSLAVAVNRRYTAFDQALADGDEVVFVPPVSGG